ncbi:antibiotic biosynthesis monooxygenase [Pedobacter sp. LMG 31464]|uniref:Antibiotic biosynthesis monooxygenase n=1 Tax=Pedobacter planticolens TaxID=2679964 RepID=A0A923DW31_9SPHI|nr:antibiotic biosynthesis monooxygenase family protein [Pedobacter planticolens]MBB2145041.1 antibiotic biosynthesis monooxygenase [Pedobacter planticolens]
MLVRVVKMHFTPSFVSEFKTLFNQVKPLISSFEGCNSVQLLQHETQPEIFFTISNWQSAEHLESYRKSELFTETWAKVKPNFANKAEAWSLLEQ